MKLLLKKTLVMTLSLLALTACDKKTNEPTQQTASTTQSAKTSNVAVSSAPVASNIASNYVASNYARVMSTAIIGSFLTSYANDAQLDNAQRECLLQGDLASAAPQLQALFDKQQSAQDKKAFDDVYGGDVGTRTIEFTKQSMRYGMGLEPKEPTMNAQDKAKIDPFNQSQAAQRLKSSLDEKQVLTATLPVVNEQIRRCGFKEIPLQAVLAQLPASASQQ